MLKPNSAHIPIAARLILARKAAGLTTPIAAAALLGMNARTYAYHEQALTGLKPADLHRCAEMFGVSHEWLSTGSGIGPKEAD